MDRLDIDAITTYTPTRVTDATYDAAVLIPVVPRANGYALVFTKRSNHLEEHPGEMSFPGGGVEPSDGDRITTAIREANEEIGLDPTGVSVVGRLDDIVTTTGYAVTPVVANVPDHPYAPNDGEVAEVAVLPLERFLDEETYRSEYRNHPDYGPIQVHYFDVDGYTVWGATARILVQFLELTTPFRPPSAGERGV